MSWKLYVLLLTALTAPARVLAAGDGFNPTEIAKPEYAWVKWVCLVVFILGIGVVAFKNPKRTHLD